MLLPQSLRGRLGLSVVSNLYEVGKDQVLHVAQLLRGDDLLAQYMQYDDDLRLEEAGVVYH